MLCDGPAPLYAYAPYTRAPAHLLQVAKHGLHLLLHLADHLGQRVALQHQRGQGKHGQRDAEVEAV